MYNRATSNRLLYTLFVTQSLFSAAQIAVFTLTTIMATRLSGSEAYAGLPSSTLTFAQALTAFPIAMLMARVGRRLGLTFGYAAGALAGVMGVLAITIGSFPLLMVSGALIGVGRGAGDQSRFAAGELFPEAERARMIGRLVFAGTVGAVVGPVLVSPSMRVMESLGFQPETGAWAGAVIVCSLAALITFFLLRPDPMTVAQKVSAADETVRHSLSDTPARPLRSLLMVPSVQLALLAMLVSQMVMITLMMMTPLHMDHLHHPQESISMVVSAHTLGMFGLSAVTGYLIDRVGRIPMMIVGALILASSALLAPATANEYILALALFLLGLGWNLGYVSGSSLLADALQGEERARVQGINDSLVFFVAGIGSLGVGPLFAAGGYFAVSAAGLILTFLLMGFIYWLARPQFAVKTA